MTEPLDSMERKLNVRGLSHGGWGVALRTAAGYGHTVAFWAGAWEIDLAATYRIGQTVEYRDR